MNTISFKPDEVLTQTADWGTKNVAAYANGVIHQGVAAMPLPYPTRR